MSVFSRGEARAGEGYLLTSDCSSFTGEMFSLEVRAAASGLAILTNWGTAFIVTLIFAPLQVSVLLLLASTKRILHGPVCHIHSRHSLLSRIPSQSFRYH